MPAGFPHSPHVAFKDKWESWQKFLDTGKRGARSQPDIWIEHGLRQVFGARRVTHDLLRLNDGMIWPDATISGWGTVHRYRGVLVEYDSRTYHVDRFGQDAANLILSDASGYRTIRIRERGLPRVGPFDILDVINPQNDSSRVREILKGIITTIIRGRMVPDDLLARARAWLGKPYIETTEELRRDLRGKHVPFEEARTWARSLGLKSETEWREFRRTAKLPHGVSSTPERVYRSLGWNGWGDYLGTGNLSGSELQAGWLPFDVARAWAVSQGIRARSQWYKRPKAPGIPATPDTVYAGRGWTHWGDFLGLQRWVDRKKDYRSFESLLLWVRQEGIVRWDQWVARCRQGLLPSDIPTHPEIVYKHKGWAGRRAFLTGEMPTAFASYEEARNYARQVGVRSQNHWFALRRAGTMPANMPSKPHETYRGNGWVSWGEFLGNGRVADHLKVYAPYAEASAWAISRGITSAAQWRALGRAGIPAQYPMQPHISYKASWVSWPVFFGKEDVHVLGVECDRP